MNLVTTFTQLVESTAADVMTSPTVASLRSILTGWVFAARRTVTGMIVASGAVGLKHHSAFHRVFSSARWSLDALGLATFAAVMSMLGEGVVALSLDETLARKRGKKVYGVGMHHDPLLSSRSKAVINWGHSWVVLAVQVRLRCIPHRVFSLPILFRLYLNHDASLKARVRYRTRPQLGVELLLKLCTAHPTRRFHVHADSTYGGKSVLMHLPVNCDMTSRMLLKARLFDAPPARKPGRGRPAKRGPLLPSPQQMLEQQRARHVVLDVYGRRDKVRLVEATAHWRSISGRAVKVVAVEPLSGGRKRQAFFSTCLTASAEDVLLGYAGRWSIEEAFLGSKSHLGFEEPPGWSREAVRRTAPMAMLLYSWVVLWFERVGHRRYQQPLRPWYPHKIRPSFADMLATLKQESLREHFSADLAHQRVGQKLLAGFFSAANAAT